MSRVSHNIDRLEVGFDDESLVADAGLLTAATLMDRLGLEDVVDSMVRLAGRPGGARPGRKVLTLVASMLLGGSHIDHADRLRAGSTGRVLGFRPMAASTVGTFLRSLTWGHVRQLDKALVEALRRAWDAGAGPADVAPVTIDVDSAICEVSGKTKEGAAYGYTSRLGYHPLLAVRADTGEIVAARLRGGASQQGNAHFVAEAVGRAGAAGEITVRADAGFWSHDLIEQLGGLGVRWSITIPLYPNVRAAIEAIPEESWESIEYTETGLAQVAETLIDSPAGLLRLVVRRTRITGHQATIWTDWRYHAFATNTDLPAVEADREHRSHASIELAVRDLKEGGLAHLPSGGFNANAAWLACAVLAYNLIRWTKHPRRRPTRRGAHRRTHRQSPPLPHPRPRCQPRRPLPAPPPRPMALGPHLPDHPRQPTRLTPTLLTLTRPPLR